MLIGVVLVLAVVQGLTEFLPVSSSGHLVLAGALFGLEDPEQNLAVAVSLHLGSVAAIVAYFFRDFLKLFRSWKEIVLLGVATIPAAVAWLLLGTWLKEAFGRPDLVGLALVGNGIFLLGMERFRAGPGMSWWKAAAIGAAQAVAMIPGISRSGWTIGAGLMLGLKPADAVRFSFLLGAIAILGATAATIPDVGQADLAVMPMILGVAVSFLVSLAAIRVVALLAERRRLGWFGLYCIAAGLLSFALLR